MTRKEEGHPPVSQRSRVRLPRPRFFAAAVLAAGLAGTAHADPTVQAAFGRDPSHGINKYEVALNWDSGFNWGNPDSWLLRLQWEVELAEWFPQSGTNRHNVTEFGFTPLLRLEKHGFAGFVPFLEVGAGARLLSSTYTSDEHRSGSAFQFGDIFGLGAMFGSRNQFEAGFRFQHVSNAGIKEPNPGTNFYTGYVRYRF